MADRNDSLSRRRPSPRPAFRAAPQVRADVVRRLRAAGCVFAEEEAELLAEAAASDEQLHALASRRADGAPLEHVVGWAAFHGLRIAVDEGVFVPRHRTELLVDEAARLAPAHAGVVDLCCGCGALGVALATELAAAGRPAARLHAADVDPAAVRCARRNLEPLGGLVHAGDLFEALPGDLRGHVDVLLANVPYVPSGAIALLPPEARLHEPRVALDGGHDGLAVLRRVADGAREWLAPGGHLLVEAADTQLDAATSAFTRAGLGVRAVRDDDAITLVGTRPR